MASRSNWPVPILRSPQSRACASSIAACVRAMGVGTDAQATKTNAARKAKFDMRPSFQCIASCHSPKTIRGHIVVMQPPCVPILASSECPAQVNRGSLVEEIVAQLNVKIDINLYPSGGDTCNPNPTTRNPWRRVQTNSRKRSTGRTRK